MSEEKSISPAHSTLPTPIALIKESWEIYKARFWVFAGIYVLTILGYIAVVAVGGIVGALTFFGFGAEFTSTPFIVITGVVVIGAIIALIYLSTLMQGAWILAADGIKKIGIRETLKHARIFIMPILLTSALSGLLAVGGYFLFIIPGILFSIWFSLSQFVVVYEKKKNLLALHTSHEYLRGNILAVIWRWIVVYAPFIILGLVMGVATEENNAVSGIINILSLFAGPFYLIYGYVLYTHLKKGKGSQITSVPQKSKLLYILLPIIGYVLFFLSVVLIIPPAINLAQTFFAEQMKTQQQQSIGNPETIERGEVYGMLLLYQEENTQFPLELADLTDSYIESLPSFDIDGFEYRYTPTADRQQFRLCMVTINGSESCTVYPSQAVETNTI
jgi:hypothetical protein